MQLRKWASADVAYRTLGGLALVASGTAGRSKAWSPPTAAAAAAAEAGRDGDGDGDWRQRNKPGAVHTHERAEGVKMGGGGLDCPLSSTRTDTHAHAQHTRPRLRRLPQCPQHGRRGWPKMPFSALPCRPLSSTLITRRSLLSCYVTPLASSSPIFLFFLSFPFPPPLAQTPLLARLTMYLF